MLTSRKIYLGATAWSLVVATACTGLLARSLASHDPWPLVAAIALGPVSAVLLAVSTWRASRSGSLPRSSVAWRAQRIVTWAGLAALWSFLIWFAFR